MVLFVIFLVIFVALVAVYAVWLRPWLRSKSWAQEFFSWIDPIELALWKKSETILFARFKMMSGILLTVLTQLGAIDLTPLMPFVPDKWEPFVKLAFNMLPLLLTLLGAIDEKLRRDTTKPLEVVAVPENPPPAVAAAVAKVETANAIAVATVAAEKEMV